MNLYFNCDVYKFIDMVNDNQSYFSTVKCNNMKIFKIWHNFFFVLLLIFLIMPNLVLTSIFMMNSLSNFYCWNETLHPHWSNSWHDLELFNQFLPQKISNPFYHYIIYWLNPPLKFMATDLNANKMESFANQKFLSWW